MPRLILRPAIGFGYAELPDIALSRIRLGCLAAPVIGLDGIVEPVFQKCVVMHGHRQWKPHAELRRLCGVSCGEAGYRENMVGKFQEC